MSKERNWLNLQPNSTNILELASPEQFECTLFKYELGVSERPNIFIRLFNEAYSETNYCVLQGVFFIDAPAQWMGAQFDSASVDETRQRLEMLGWLHNISRESYEERLQTFYLVTVKAIQPKYDIRFLVRGAYVDSVFS